MFTVLAIMLAGILAGYGLRNRSFIRLTGKAISVMICVLLFLLGVAVGADRQIVDRLSDLGGQAAILSLGATAGSVAAAWGLYRLIRRKGGAQS